MSVPDAVISYIWCHVSFLMGVFGNSYVIYSTVFHKAIKLDKLSVWIIKNLAVSDLANTIILLIPVIVSLYAQNSWILGDTFCKISFLYKYVGYVTNVVLINALSLNKMLRCLYPLRNMICTKTQRCSVTVLTAITSLIIPSFHFYMTILLKDIFIIDFSKSQCMCWMVQASEPESWHLITDYVLAGVLNALPCITLIGMNTFLVIYAAKKSTRSINKMNILVVILITASFLVSSLPYFVYYMISGDVWDDNDSTLRFVTFVMFLTLWSNPVIYLVTNSYFRRFTVESVQRARRSENV